jgi:hypothetical protein
MPITPADSRYVPLTQQDYCCVPTCLQMVMYKSGIPLLPAEEIGYHLGLIVPPAENHLFFNVRTSTEKPPAGYGTRIYLPEFEPNEAFKNLQLPLRLTVKPITQFSSADDLLQTLREVEAQDGNALLCYNHGALVDDPSRDWGHVVVFDRIIDGDVRIVDPSPSHPKWRTVKPGKLFEAMKEHGEERSAGIWLIEKT